MSKFSIIEDDRIVELLDVENKITAFEDLLDDIFFYLNQGQEELNKEGLADYLKSMEIGEFVDSPQLKLFIKNNI